MTMSISITLDDELGEELNAAVAGSNRSALVTQAIREYWSDHIGWLFETVYGQRN